jgi:hypothetical protein
MSGEYLPQDEAHRAAARQANLWSTVKAVIDEWWRGPLVRKWEPPNGKAEHYYPPAIVLVSYVDVPYMKYYFRFGTSDDGQDELLSYSLVEPTLEAAPDIRTLAGLLHQRTGLVVEVKAPTTQIDYWTTMGGGTLWREPRQIPLRSGTSVSTAADAAARRRILFRACTRSAARW